MNTVKCFECDNTFDKSLSKCPICGCPKMEKGLICPECEESVSINDTKCRTCGYPIELISQSSIEEKMDTNENEESVIKKNIKLEAISNVLQERVDDIKTTNTKTFPIWITTLIILTFLGGTIGGFFYYNIYLPEKIDREALRYYTLSNGTNLRSSQVTGVDYNKVTTLPYGSEIIVYNYGSEWSSVKANGQKGYIASNLLVNKQDFFLLNSIFGDSDSKDCIFTTKCRKALLDYYKEKKYIGYISDETLSGILPFHKTSDNQWQIFCRPQAAKPNSVFYPRLSNKNSKFTDFAVLIKNIVTKERRILIFSFDDDETPHLFYENIAPDIGYIKYISRDYVNMVMVQYTD